MKLGPGIYVDATGDWHISTTEMCDHFGVPETDENIAQIMISLREVLRDAYGAEAADRVEIIYDDHSARN